MRSILPCSGLRLFFAMKERTLVGVVMLPRLLSAIVRSGCCDCPVRLRFVSCPATNESALPPHS